MGVLKARRLQKIAIGLLAVVVVALGTYASVQAGSYSGTVYGRTTWHGYFTNRLDTNGIEVLPAISGGKAIPNSINSVSELINLLKNANSSGNNQRHTGSAFIVNTMLGRSGPGGGRDVSAADWADLTDRLNARESKGKISWTGNVSSSINSYYQGGTTNDDAYYDEYHNEPGIRIFHDDGSIAYELLRRCANPMGDTSGVDKPEPTTPPSGTVGVCVPMDFAVTVGTDADGNAVPMGVTISGPPPLSRRSYGPYISSQVVNVTNPYTTGDLYTVTFKETRSYIDYYYDVPVYDKSKPPKIIGYVTTAHYAAARSGGSTTIGPCYDYKLTPGLVTNPSGSPAVIEPNAPLTATYSVTNGPGNTGYSTKSMATTWQMTKIIVQPGVPDSAWNSNGSSSSLLPPCGTFFRSAGVRCTATAPASRVFPKSSTTQLGADSLISDDLEVGTRICYALSVKPYRPYTNAAHTILSTEWRHSKPACLIVGKKPKVQVWGGDLSVGKVFNGGALTTSNVQTSISMKSGSQMFGSWVEYGIFARGAVIGTGSGSAFADPGRTGTLADVCGYSRLSFTNFNNDSSCSTVGKYTSAKLIPTVAASFPGNSSLPVGFSGKPSDLPSGTYNTGSLTLNTSTLASGKSVILKVAGTVTIIGDQTYSPGPYSVAGQLPQLVIIADKIVINDAVKNVDAWLISKGDLMTCSSVPPLTSNICNQQLTVNGPVMALRLLLFRTYGSGAGADSGTPAEIFNLRADTYLWATSRAIGNGRVQTVDTTELPPRL